MTERLTIKVEHSEDQNDFGGADENDWNLRKIDVTAGIITDEKSNPTYGDTQDIIFLKQVTASSRYLQTCHSSCSATVAMDDNDDNDDEPELTEATEQASATDYESAGGTADPSLQHSRDFKEQVLDLNNTATLFYPDAETPSTSRSSATTRDINENRERKNYLQLRKPDFSRRRAQGHSSSVYSNGRKHDDDDGSDELAQQDGKEENNLRKRGRRPPALWRGGKCHGNPVRPYCPECRREHFIKDCPRRRFGKRRGYHY